MTSTSACGGKTSSGEFQLRVALHDTGDGDSHLDLFIDVSASERLVTMEIPASAESFLKKSFGSENQLHLKGTIPGPYSEGCLITGIRKADHRRLYLEYEGEITGARGTLTHIADGTYSGYLPGPGQAACISIL